MGNKKKVLYVSCFDVSPTFWLLACKKDFYGGGVRVLNELRNVAVASEKKSHEIVILA